VSRILDALPRPLDPLRSIKLKLSILLGASGAAGAAVFWYGMGFFPPKTTATAIGVALITSQVLAHGMTAPLREMTAAARAMARGDYTRRVRATSRDEVGQLAIAFNQMAADLASADQQRRELIANVSHELRTPISALQAVLENIIDGVAAPDPATLRTALTQTERLGRSPNCSTCRASTPACSPSTSTSSPSPTCSRTWWRRPRSPRSLPTGRSSFRPG
jgi:signal transduction histidine kinase